MHYKNPSLIPNPNLNPDSCLIPYYPKMPTREDPDLDAVTSPAQGNPPMSFAAECVANNLEDQSLFNNPVLV